MFASCWECVLLIVLLDSLEAHLTVVSHYPSLCFLTKRLKCYHLLPQIIIYENLNVTGFEVIAIR